MLFSCSENLYEDHFSHSKIKTQKVSLNDDFLIQNSKLMKSVNQIKSLNNQSHHKIIYDSINDFYIDDENGIFLDYNGAISYSFRVLRDDSTESSKVENIVFNQIETGDYDSYLLKYAFSKTELDALTFEGANTINYEIEDVDVLISNKTTAPKCRTIRISKCGDSGTEWDCGGGICGYDYVIQCDEGGGGSGTQTGDGIITTPVGGGGNANLDLPPDPCTKLKNLFSATKGNIKPTIINDLRPNIAVNTSGEKGHSLTKNNTGTILGIPILPSSINTTRVPFGGYYYCALHTHPLDVQPMFSFSDVITLNNLNNNTASFNDGFASFLLVCQDDNGVFQTYAIVFDPISLNETIDQFISNPENIGCSEKEVKEKMDSKLEEEYYLEDSSSNPNYERAFLRTIFNTNVSLYQANSALTNWSKLSLSNNSATATVNSTNCN